MVIENKKYRIVAFITTIVMILSFVQPLNLIKPLWANEPAEPVIDETNHFSLTFGWPGTPIEGGTISQTLAFTNNAANTRMGSSRIIYNASGYEGTYEAGALNITITTPFYISSMGADGSINANKYAFYKKSQTYDKDTCLYTYILSNHNALRGDVFDGYIDIYYSASLNSLVKNRGVTDLYDKEAVNKSMEEPYTISCSLTSETNNLNLKADDLSVKIDPYESYKAINFNTSQRTSCHYSDNIIDKKVGLTFDMRFSTTNGWYPIEYTDYIFLLPDYADASSIAENIEELPETHPYYSVYQKMYPNLKAYIYSIEKMNNKLYAINVMYPTEYMDTDQSLTVVVYNSHDEDRAQEFSSALRTATGHIGTIVPEAPVDGNHDYYPNLYQYSTSMNAGQYDPFDESYSAPGNFDTAQINGIYQNADLYEAIAPQTNFFHGIGDSTNIPNGNLSYTTINNEIENLQVDSRNGTFIDANEDSIETNIIVLTKEDYNNLSDKEKEIFDYSSQNIIINNNVFESSEGLNVYNPDTDEIENIEYKKAENIYNQLNIVNIADGLTKDQAIELYTQSIAAKNEGQSQYILAFFICKDNDSLKDRSKAYENLFYFPIYNFYIKESGEDIYKIVVETSTPESTYSIDGWGPCGPTSCSLKNCLVHNYKNSFIPLYAIISETDITENLQDLNSLNYQSLGLGENNNTDNSDTNIYKNVLDIIKGMVRSEADEFAQGYDVEFYLDFNTIDFECGKNEILNEDDFEYTYVRTPGRTLAHYSPKSIGKNILLNANFNGKTEWEIYVKTRGEDEEYKFADSINNPEYLPGDDIKLPSGTISVRIKIHKSAALLEAARQLSGTWIADISKFKDTPWGYESTKTGYGVKIYPETVQKAESTNRYSLNSFSYSAVASWKTDKNGEKLFNNRIHHYYSNITSSHTDIENEMFKKYGEYKEDLVIGNSFKRDTALASSSIVYNPSNSSDTNPLVKDVKISGLLKFEAADNLNYEKGLINEYSDDIFKIKQVDNYIIISKILGFTPSNIELTVTGDLVSDKNRLNVSNVQNYINSHSTYDIIDGDTINIPGKLIIKFNSDFRDDPIVNSYATNSSNINFGYSITGTIDAIIGMPETYIEMFSFIDGDKEGEPYAYKSYRDDGYDLNGNGDSSDKTLYSSTKTPETNSDSLAGHRTVLLEEKSSATYDTYKIGAGKASAGEDFKTKLTITTAANILKNVIIYDYFWDETKNSDWNPTFKSVNIPNPENYTVYYSNLSNPGEYGNDSSWTEYNADTITPEEKSAIKSIAIVFIDGYSIPNNSNISYSITFTAPALQEGIGKKFINTNVFVAASYNEDGVQTGTAASLESNEANIELVLDKSLVAIRLRDSDNLSPLQGGTFEIHSAEDGALVTEETFTTASDGLTASIKLPVGKYYAKQTNTIEGYVHQKDEYSFSISVAILNKDITIVDAYNRRGLADVIFHKYDDISKKPLTGAILALTDINDSNVIYKTKASDTEGLIKITVPWGDYYLTEARTPTGYLPINKTLITIPAESVGKEFDINVPDPRQASKVTLNVISAADETPIDDAEYDLFKSDGEKVESYTTNEKGQIIINSLDWGSYYFLASNEPNGYEKSENKLEFTLDENKFIVELTDRLAQHFGTVRLIKTDVDNPDKTLQGAIYTLYDVDGYKYRTNLVTNANGEVIVDELPWGSYYFVEESAPFGYSLSDKKTIININKYTASQEQKIAVTDSSTAGSILITKKIKADDVDLSAEVPTFIFKVTGSVNGVEKYSYFTAITFDDHCYLDEGYYINTSIMSDLPQCEWSVEEQPVIRYAPSKITTSIDTDNDTENNVVINQNSAQFMLTPKSLNANVIFTNDKLYKEGFSSIDTKVNSLTGENKVVGIIAKTDEPSYAPNTKITLDDIKLSYIKDDGTEELIDPKDINVPDGSGQTSGTKIEVSEVNIEYDQPGTYIYPITITINDNTVYESIVKIQISEFIYEKLDEDTITITGYRGKKSVVEIPQTIDGFVVTQIGSAYYENDAQANDYNNNNTNTYPLIIGNDSVEKIILPNTIKVISNNAFGYGSKFHNLKEIVISSGTHITDICPYAFYFNPNAGLGLNCDSFVFTVEDNVIIDNLHRYAIYRYSGNNVPSNIEMKMDDSSYIKRYYSYSLGITSEEYNFSEGTEIISSNTICNSLISKTSIPYSLKLLESYALTNNTGRPLQNITIKSINCLFENSSVYSSTNFDSSKEYTLTIPFYTTNLFGLSTNYGNGINPLTQYINYSYPIKIIEDESILDGIDWEYKASGKTIINNYNNNINARDINYLEKTLNCKDVNAIEYLGYYLYKGNDEDYTITLPDSIESIFGLYQNTPINISENSKLKEFDYVYGNSSETQFNFANDVIPDSVEIFNNYMPTHQNGSFSENSKAKYVFNVSYGMALNSSQSIIPKELRAGEHIYSPQNNSTVQLNSTDLKLVSSLLYNNFYYSNPSLINYRDYYYYMKGEPLNINIYIKNGVTNIPAYTFANYKGYSNTSYNNETLDSDISAIEKNVNINVCVSDITIPDTTIRIGSSAFENISMENIYLGNNIKSIDDKAFYSTYIKMVKEFGAKKELLYEDFKLKGVGENNKIILPDSLEYIGSTVFGPSNTITEIHIGKNLKYLSSDFIKINEYPSLSHITVDEANPYMVCPDGKTIYNKDLSRIIFTIDESKQVGPTIEETNHFVLNGTELIDVVNPDGDLIEIPNTITTIGVGALARIETKEIVLPNSLQTISDFAFYNSTINKINIPENTVSIGDYAFSYSLATNDMNVTFFNNLQNNNNVLNWNWIKQALQRINDTNKSMEIDFSNSKSLKSIGKGAFMSKKIVSTIRIPSNVEIIDDLAFANCRDIPKVVFENDSKLKTINFGAFIGVGTRFSILTYLNSYYNSDEFYSPAFDSLPSSLETIDDFAFFETQFTSYNFEKLYNLKYIGSYSLCEFACRAMTTNQSSKTTRTLSTTKHIVIPENVKYMGYDVYSESRAASEYSNQSNHNSFVSSVYIKSPDINIASISTFGTTVYRSAGPINNYLLNSGSSYNNMYDNIKINAITVYGNSNNIKDYCNKFGYNYIQYTEDLNKSGFKYNALMDGSLEIIGVNPDIDIPNLTLTIPSTINGSPVKAIASGAFDSPITRSTVKVLNIEEGIKEIGSDLFMDLNVLAKDLKNTKENPTNCLSNWYAKKPTENIDETIIGSFIQHSDFNTLYGIARTIRPAIVYAELPQSVISIGSPFRGCPVCQSNISSLKNIKEFKASYMTGITGTYSIPEGVTELPPYWDAGLTSVQIILPESIKIINDYSLNKSSTVSFEKNPKIEYLGDNAIINPININGNELSELTHLGSNNNIAPFAEDGILNLSSIQELKQNSIKGTYKQIDLGNKITSIPANIFSSPTTIDTLIIPNSVKNINNGSFAYVKNLILPEKPFNINTSITFNANGTVQNLENAQNIYGGIANYPESDLVLNTNTILGISYLPKTKTITFTSHNLSILPVSPPSKLFNNCTTLTDIIFKGENAPTNNPYQINNYYTSYSRFLYSIPEGTTIHIPTGSRDSYVKWFKELQYNNSNSNTIDKAIEAGIINLVEESE